MVASSVAGFREGDWMCPSCNNHNYSSKIACNRCGAAKADAYGAPGQAATYGAPSHAAVGPSPGSFRAGDWLCPRCNNHNFASKAACNRCGGAKVAQQLAPSYGAYLTNAYDKAVAPAPTARSSPYGLPYGGKGAAPAKPSATGMRPGDWCCPGCFNHNYASRTACGRCGMPKMPQMHGPLPAGGVPMGCAAAVAGAVHNGAGGKGQGAKRQGDWTCYGCGNNNYASRTEACNRCGLPKTVFVSKSGMRPGDWVCPGCQNHNWADRTSCMKCGTAKGASQVHTQGMKPGDWLCTQCSNHNFSGKERCNRCQHPKQPGAFMMSAAA